MNNNLFINVTQDYHANCVIVIIISCSVSTLGLHVMQPCMLLKSKLFMRLCDTRLTQAYNKNGSL